MPYWKVLARISNSDNWTALDVSSHGELALAYGMGVGLRFADEASARDAGRLISHYGIRAAQIAEVKVSRVEEDR